MQRLLHFLFRYRVFILFLILEGLSSWILIENNSYQGAKFFNSSNQISATITQGADNVSNYFDLVEKNQQLAEENVKLRQMLMNLTDSVAELSLNSTLGIKAKVIDNSLYFRNNYLIINRGEDDGVIAGMGVVGPDGIVGQVQKTSGSYSTIVSLLHSKTMISAKHKNTGSLCSVVWEGDSPLQANVSFLPRHLKISRGDSIFTSGFNSVYLEDYLIGIVDEVNIRDDATFYDVKIDLATDFGSLSFVYLLHLQDREEIDSLRSQIPMSDG